MKRRTISAEDSTKSENLQQSARRDKENHDHRFREWIHPKVVKAIRRRQVVLKPLS
jgi:hypothetical protein